MAPSWPLQPVAVHLSNASGPEHEATEDVSTAHVLPNIAQGSTPTARPAGPWHLSRVVALPARVPHADELPVGTATQS